MLYIMITIFTYSLNKNFKNNKGLSIPYADFQVEQIKINIRR